MTKVELPYNDSTLRLNSMSLKKISLKKTNKIKRMECWLTETVLLENKI